LHNGHGFVILTERSKEFVLDCRLRPSFDLPLHVPIQSVVVTQGNSHLLAPLRDGRLMVLGIATSA